MIIAGHGRVRAAKKLGLREVPVMVATGWTKAQIAGLCARRQQARAQCRLGRGPAGAGDRRTAGDRLRPRPHRLLDR